MEEGKEDSMIYCFERNDLESVLEKLIERHLKYEDRRQLSVEIVKSAEFILGEYINTEEG